MPDGAIEMKSEECKRAILKRGKEDSLLRWHPWVFSGAIHHFSAPAEDGEVVEVWADDGEQLRFIATGHYQRGSIMVRVLSWQQESIDQAFYERRLQVALQMRQALGFAVAGNEQAPSGSFRLVHGEGDGLPGLIIDIYGQTAVMQAHSVGMHLQRQCIANALKAVMQERVANIYYKSDTTLPFFAEHPDISGYLLGGAADDVAVENGLRFHVDWLHGQKTGYFLDQRDNRALLERYARGRRVLNMFCYTGGFSLYALRGGATLVHSVDSSQKAIDLTNANVALNFPSDARHEAFAEDAFRFLDRMEAGNYDLIVLDPPAFAKHREAVHNALKGYTRLNAKALSKLPPHSLLFTFSCSQVISKDAFRTAVFTAAAQARRQVRILHQLHQAPDHPVSIYHPEGEYLKGLVLYVES